MNWSVFWTVIIVPTIGFPIAFGILYLIELIMDKNEMLGIMALMACGIISAAIALGLGWN